MTKYYIDDELVNEEGFYNVLEEEVRMYVEDNYDDILDEIYEPYEIGCCTFDASMILKELDPIAYNCGVDDEVDARLSDFKYDIERGEEVEINGYYFRIEEDEEDEE